MDNSLPVSIITINRNNASGLKLSIDSVVSQSFDQYEYIIIDGNSSDESVNIIKEHEEHISYWNSEPDIGIYDAMNKGIGKATGNYCYFLNSGDFFASPYVLEKLFSEVQKADFVYGNLLVYDSKNKKSKIKGKPELTFFDIYMGLLKHQSTFIRREMFETYGLYDSTLKIIADWDFFIKTIGMRNASFRYLDIDIACFNNNGISSAYSKHRTIIGSERETIKGRYLPTGIIADYDFFRRHYRAYRIIHYRFPLFIIRLMYPFIKLYERCILKK